VIHTISPKAGLLGSLAGYWVGVPIRIHTFTGQVWANKRGVSKKILMLLDKMIGIFCTHLLTDSESQKKFIIENGIVPKFKIEVLGKGSVCGVDPARFNRKDSARKALRENLGIGPFDVVFLYIGRLNKDKGIYDLLEAYSNIEDKRLLKSWLFMVGPCEDEKILRKITGGGERVLYYEYSTNPEQYYWMADVLCLPSYREGFGNVIIEGASACLPSMASNIYGISDAVERNKSGLLHEPGNIQEIIECFKYWMDNPENIKKMGLYAQLRAELCFNVEYLVKEFLTFYKKIGVKF
jgi:glycosyltransferase involved in cell wall biosynthesis